MIGAQDLSATRIVTDFDKLAMLAPEPRLASVTAVKDTLLLRIDHRPFYKLIADRIEVAQGITKILAGYVRDRLADMADLDQPIRQATDRSGTSGT
ncbi:MAG: hypothetical protein HC822_12945 [Oscillochloris sp.]|nr:hypothetical protein [Oscillochloris sp.]